MATAFDAQNLPGLALDKFDSQQLLELCKGELLPSASLPDAASLDGLQADLQAMDSDIALQRLLMQGRVRGVPSQLQLCKVGRLGTCMHGT